MTKDERQALREKHQPCVDCYLCDGVGPLHCNECGLYEYWVDWPCDLIQVLDETEQTYKRGYNDGWENCNKQWKEL